MAMMRCLRAMVMLSAFSWTPSPSVQAELCHCPAYATSPSPCAQVLFAWMALAQGEEFSMPKASLGVSAFVGVLDMWRVDLPCGL